MTTQRKLAKTYFPAAEAGFLGAGHTARAAIQVPFQESDPFILLMDDVLDKKDNDPVGGPHPHAGFETVSLLLEGGFGEGEHRMQAGDFQMMTAGNGVVHTETIAGKTKMRLLQLWLSLPKKDRWAQPRLQDLPSEHVPALDQAGLKARVYSGTLGGVTSPVQNHTPTLIADVQLDPGAAATLQIPAEYNTFLYGISGLVQVGDDGQSISPDQVGWLNRLAVPGMSELALRAGPDGGRLILYGGLPTGDEIVQYGPFIADTMEQIRGLYTQYNKGWMEHILEMPEAQRVVW